jgi:hypothetical protein
MPTKARQAGVAIKRRGYAHRPSCPRNKSGNGNDNDDNNSNDDDLVCIVA